MSIPPIPRIQIAAVIASTSNPVSAKVGIKSNRPVPTPGKGEILVKLEFSGVCHSDLHSIRGDTPMLTDVAGHEGVGRVVKGKNYRCIRLNAVQNVYWHSSLLLVGPEVDEKQWIGTRVGIRSVSFIPNWSSGWSYIDANGISTGRWLYSSCRQCEICEINHTVCPYQKNAGAVSCWLSQIMCLPLSFPLLIVLMACRMYLERSNVSILSIDVIIRFIGTLLISCLRVYCQSSTPCDKDSGATFSR